MLYFLSIQPYKFQVILILSKDSGISVNDFEKIFIDNVHLDLVFLNDDFYKNFFLPSEKHVSKETYSRYYLFSENFSQFSKILYLDVDLYLKGDIKELWDIKITSEYNIGMVQEGIIYDSLISGSILPPSLLPVQYKTIYKHFNRSYITRYEYITQYLKIVPTRYFNNGVLLINVKSCIENKLFEKYLKTINANTFYYPGQDPQNFVDNEKIYSLPYKYNIIPYFSTKKFEFNCHFKEEFKIFNEYYEAYRDAPSIIHYTGPNKPWNYFYQDKNAKEFYKISQIAFKKFEIITDNYRKNYRKIKCKSYFKNFLISIYYKVMK